MLGDGEAGADAERGQPFFSVVIPTFRRPKLLREAVESVLGQTCGDFEVVVSDDEDPPGEAWAMLQEFSERDNRIRAVRNHGPRGQVHNTNNAIREATGVWIKPLHDDDILYPRCLESFFQCLRRPSSEGISLACCRSDLIRLSGDVKPWRPRCRRPAVEVVTRRNVVLAMYLQEDIGSSIPSCICVHRAGLLKNEAWMPQHPDLFSSVDSHWALVLGTLGHRLVINAALVGKREEPASVTANTSDEALDREQIIIRQLQFPKIAKDLRPPSLPVVIQSLALRRAAHRLFKRRRPMEALRLALKARHPAAWLLTARSALSARWPDLFNRAPRVPWNET